MENSNRKALFSFLAGAAAGVAVAAYVTSDHGQKTVSQVKNQLTDIVEKGQTSTRNFVERGLDSTIHQAEQIINGADKLKERVSA